MAQLYFYYSAMNAGKSTILLQTQYNYKERGMRAAIFIPQIGERDTKGKVLSRIGLSASALTFSQDFDFFAYLKKDLEEQKSPLACVLIDEAQFLTKAQVHQLSNIVDQLQIPVLTYGLRTDFRGELFQGSYYLLAWADSIKEVKNICHCGKKATMNMRMDATGKKVIEGPQVQVGGNETYVATCRKHFTAHQATPFVK